MEYKCEFCGNEKTGHHRYKKTCGSKECVVGLRKKTNLERFGHVSNLHSEEGKIKIQESLKNRYGEHITNVSQIQEVKDKKKETCLLNNGVEWPMQSESIRGKSKETCLEKYGVDNVSKNKEVIDKIQKSLSIIDPITGETTLEKSMKKREDNCFEKYGVKYFFQTDEFFESIGRKRNLNVSDFLKYRRIVNRVTEKTFKDNFDILCCVYFRGEEYHLDHIYSVYDGYINSVDPNIIGSISNLQLISKKINLNKSVKSWQTLEELVNKHNKI